jgi:H+/Na+-translocating ferredoxin:NAD+ oxidoreductase subunit C
LTAKNQFTVKAKLGDFTTGIQYLRKMMPGRRIVLAVFPGTVQQAEKTGAEVKVIKPDYPNALPKIIMKKVLGRSVPIGKRCEDLGVSFVSAESVVSLAQAFKSGRIPVNKMLTLIHKNGAREFVRARIGTPVRHILNTVGIETGEGDRVVLGGPMVGQTLSSADTPISSDTDAIMVQDRSQIVRSTDTHCFNCGECVRACPADIPVNMLVRVLENGLYEEAVAEYDLLSCVECGLCSYVCVARIPVFQYIMLGKYEVDRTTIAEGSNG